jgi:hypothetical protein
MNDRRSPSEADEHRTPRHRFTTRPVQPPHPDPEGRHPYHPPGDPTVARTRRRCPVLDGSRGGMSVGQRDARGTLRRYALDERPWEVRQPRITCEAAEQARTSGGGGGGGKGAAQGKRGQRNAPRTQRRARLSSAIEKCRSIAIEKCRWWRPERRLFVPEPGVDGGDAWVVGHDVIGDVPELVEVRHVERDVAW